MEIKIQLSKDEYKDLVSYCELNKFDIEDIIRKSYKGGFNIEKYGLLSSNGEIKEREVIKEIIKEVPVEKIVEKIVEVPIDRIHEKIVEVIKEVPGPTVEIEVIKYVDREVIKEVFIDNPVSNIDNICDKNYVNDLINKITELENRPVEVKEIIIEKTDDTLKTKLNSLQTTLHNLRQENLEKDKKIKDCEKMVEELKKLNNNMGAVYLNRSNLDDKLYK